MKNRKVWFWLMGLTLVSLIVCSSFVALGLWAASRIESGSTGPAFGDAVGIVKVEGVIMPGEAPVPSPFTSDSAGAYSQEVIENLKNAEANTSVKAIILFVDSPGGSVFASDEIALQIKQMTKPVITAMGSLAASGGYYIAAPTQEIWASPHTLTCSIGVISQFLNLEGFAQEYGITAITVKSGQFKDTGNPFREFTPEDEALWQAIIDEAYGSFVKIVADGRQMSEEEVRQVADGRICTGTQAQAMGLVDKLGYLPEVIKRAGELGSIAGEPRIIEYENGSGFWGSLGSALYRPSPVEELQQLLRYHAGSPLMYLYTGP